MSCNKPREIWLRTVADVLRNLRPGDDEDIIFQRECAEAAIAALAAPASETETVETFIARTKANGWVPLPAHEQVLAKMRETEKLPAKWRNDRVPDESEYHDGVFDARNRCADELEAALKADRCAR